MWKQLVRATLAKAGYQIHRVNGDNDFVLWARQEEFARVYEAVKPHTFLTMDRLFMLWQYARAARTLEGDAAEVGVYRGGSAKLIAEAFAGSGKALHLFDTFVGMPAVTPALDGDYRTGDFADTSLEAVRRLFGVDDAVRWYPGSSRRPPGQSGIGGFVSSISTSISITRPWMAWNFSIRDWCRAVVCCWMTISRSRRRV